MTNPVGTIEGKNDLTLKEFVFLPVIEIIEYSAFDS